jgi:hypothetical protein
MWDFGQCDAKRCTGKKLSRAGWIKELKPSQRCRGRAIVLSPDAKQVNDPRGGVDEGFGRAGRQGAGRHVKSQALLAPGPSSFQHLIASTSPSPSVAQPLSHQPLPPPVPFLNAVRASSRCARTTARSSSRTASASSTARGTGSAPTPLLLLPPDAENVDCCAVQTVSSSGKRVGEQVPFRDAIWLPLA